MGRAQATTDIVVALEACDMRMFWLANQERSRACEGAASAAMKFVFGTNVRCRRRNFRTDFAGRALLVEQRPPY
ncbi:hypothetical protein AC579_10327 [Pseudocercospora musae]|uniref:Uncharacterized protein n=1 Tax=Pseudocercospora musae TaxID=113226 RepID=A0A139IAJ7_9PEZI|nr:hypothetical protein AC579_10327 [Pseudocercospora musae]